MPRCIAVVGPTGGLRKGVSRGRCATDANGAPCCCEGGCCIISTDWPAACAEKSCCNWGRQFVIAAQGTTHSFAKMFFQQTGQTLTGTQDVTWDFIARFGCQKIGETSAPLFMDCLKFSYKFKKAGSLFGGTQIVNATCANLDQFIMPNSGGTPRQFLQLFAETLRTGSGLTFEALDIGYLPALRQICGPNTNEICSFVCEPVCPQTGAKGTARRTWNPECYAGEYSASYTLPSCGAAGAVTDGNGAGAGQYSVWVEQTCPGACQPPNMCDQFLACWVDGLACADLNGDGFVDGIDYDTFMNLFDRECGGSGNSGESRSRLRTRAALMRRAGLKMKVVRV